MKDVLHSIAQGVRIWAELKSQVQDPINSRDLNGWCAIASGQLYRKLIEHGFKPKLRVAEGQRGSHVFVVVDDYIVDVTATQFPEFSKCPIVIEHERVLENHWFYKNAAEFPAVEPLITYQKRKRWPEEQVAWEN